MSITEKMKQSKMYAGYNEDNKTRPFDVDSDKTLSQLLAEGKQRKFKKRFIKKVVEPEEIKKPIKYKNPDVKLSDLTKDEQKTIEMFNNSHCIAEIKRLTNISRHFILKAKKDYRHLILLTDSEMHQISLKSKYKNRNLTPRKLTKFSISVFKLFDKGYGDKAVAIVTKRSMSYIKQVRGTYDNRKLKG